MSNYKINQKFDDKSIEQIVNFIKAGISKNTEIESITGIKYKITSIDTFHIEYIGEYRKNGNPEIIFYADIKNTIKILKELKYFNTANKTLKSEIPNKIYKKRSPLFAILLEANIIAKVYEQ